MVKRKHKFLGIMLCICISLLSLLGAYPANEVYADSGYYIKNFDVQVNVNSDRTYDITETIDVYFTEESHGIIRDIPTWATEEREVRLQNVSVEGAEYEHDGYGEIKIGSADEYVIGDMRYVIKYTLWHYADEEPDYDYMYLNVIGTEWDTKIENYTSTITLPDNARINKITLSAGSYGSTDGSYADYSVNGNVINIAAKHGLSAYEGVTVNVQMIEGAFADAEVWQPDLYIHNVDVEAVLNDEGVLHVKEVFDVTVNEATGMSICLNDSDEDYNSKVENAVVYYPDGKTDKDACYERYCYLDFYNYEGRRISVSLEYDKTYYIRSGQEKLKVEQQIIPAYYDIIVDNISANASMPFEIEESSVKIGEIISYYSKYDPDVTIHFSDDMKSASITTDGKVDTYNYFYLCFGTEKGNFNTGYTMKSYIFGGIALVVIALAIIFMLTKRPYKYFPVVEFYPPNGMTPAEMGYIVDGRLSSRDMVSMIYYWASRGYLDIVMLNKKDFYLKRKKSLSNYKPFEKGLFDGLWLGYRDTSSPADLKERYYKYINSAIKSIENSYGGKGALLSKGRNVLSVIFGYIMPMLFIFVSGVYSLALLGDSADSGVGYFVTMLFFIWLVYRMGNKLYQNKLDGLKSFSNILRLVVGIGAIIYIAGAYGVAVGGFLFNDFVALCVGLVMAVIIFLAPTIKRRSEFGEELLNKTLGFRMFLETAEKEKLQLLCDENPQYFYDILPYAQVLGVTKKWIKLFDGITIPPAEYVGATYGNAYYDYRAFDRITSRIHSAAKSTPAPSGGDSGGGGFSSGGGGGFSSGGFSGGGSGGGGGSRW